MENNRGIFRKNHGGGSAEAKWESERIEEHETAKKNQDHKDRRPGHWRRQSDPDPVHDQYKDRGRGCHGGSDIGTGEGWL